MNFANARLSAVDPLPLTLGERRSREEPTAAPPTFTTKIENGYWIDRIDGKVVSVELVTAYSGITRSDILGATR